MASAASSDKPARVRSRGFAAASAEAPPSASSALMSEAPPTEGAFRITNQSRCFVAAPFYVFLLKRFVRMFQHVAFAYRAFPIHDHGVADFVKYPEN